MNRREARGGPGRHTPLEGLTLALFGPTASGKTAVAEALVDRIAADVISADAMQAYRGLPLLTNQPARPTRLVGIWPLDHEGSVGAFATLAHAAVDDTLAAGRTPVVAGGTGLYLRAALVDLGVPPPASADARRHWEAIYDRLGASGAHAALAERDPEAASVIHANDRRRVVRALELAEGGRSLRPGESRLWSTATRVPTVVIGLDVSRDVLAERISARTRRMIEQGAVAEARTAAGHPISRGARGIIGLRELTTLPLEEAVAAIDVRTRRYAAYQRKWMRRIPGIVTVDGDRPPGVVADEILEVARARERLPARRAG